LRRLLLGSLIVLGTIAATARAADPPASLYHLDAALTSQAGVTHDLDVYRGHPVLITMFYASCPATCPLIIDTLRATERELTAQQRAALRELAVTRHIDTRRWTLARADAATVRNIAALLNVQYRQLPGGEFNHSTMIALLSPQGEIEASSATLGHADPALLARLRD
jgi:protein SCO1/2